MKGDLILKNQSSSLPISSFDLATGTLILGRSSRCDLVVTDITISRRHAELAIVDGCVTVHDLNSRNGTYLEDERVDTCRVQVGQRLRFGSIQYLLGRGGADMDQPNSEQETGPCGDGGRMVDMDISGFSLSRAQDRVFRLLFEALPQKQIARRLNLSFATVHNHIQAIYDIFKVHSRTELLSRFLRKNSNP